MIAIKQDLGYGLTEHLAAHGVLLVQRDGAWIAEGATDEQAQALIDAYNPWPVEKARKLQEINDWFASQVAALTAGIPQAEKDSWPVQVNEAYGLRPLAMLPAMAAGRGISVEVLIEKVKAKAEAFSMYYGAIQGERDRVEDLIKSMPDAGEYHRLPELWGLKCMG